MKIEKKHYIWGVVIIVLILIYIYRKQLMKSMGFDDSTIRKFCGGGALGYGGWFSPSRIWTQSTPAINQDTQSIYRISCEPAYFDGVKWNAKCSYPGLTGNFYQTIGSADSAEGAMVKARYQIENNAMITRSRPGSVNSTSNVVISQ